MSVTRKFLRDNYPEISKYGNQFVNYDYFTSLGWNAVPIIDVKKAISWKAVQADLINQGFGDYLIGRVYYSEWVKFSISI